nr:PadR family transcriptional regulator [Candidatus Njordarchaeota archaeon]
MAPTKPTRPVTGRIPAHLPASDVVVLACIALRKGEISGKEIDGVLDQQGTRNWADIGSSSVYNCLNRLEQYGYVRSGQSKKEGHGVKLYSVTQEGLARLEKELVHRLSTHKKSLNELDIGIASVPLLKKQDVLKSLRAYMENLDNNLQTLESNISPLRQFGLLRRKKPDERVGSTTIGGIDPRDVQLISALFERPYRELRARKQWLREFIEKIENDYVWCADQEPNLKILEADRDESQERLEKKRKERGKKAILI